jgi:hypothetical protein
MQAGTGGLDDRIFDVTPLSSSLRTVPLASNPSVG